MAEPRTPRAEPKTLLAAIGQRPPLNLDWLLRAVDGERQRLAREADGWRLRHLLDGIDEPLVGSGRAGRVQACFHRS
jgi:hypothetical protein